MTSQPEKQINSNIFNAHYRKNYRQLDHEFCAVNRIEHEKYFSSKNHSRNVVESRLFF